MTNKDILTILSSLNVPVNLHTYSGTDETYITFFQYDENGSTYADDEEIATSIYYQINVFSKNDYTSLVQQVKQKMKEINFNRTSETALYDGEYYQKSIRFTSTIHTN